MENRLLPIPGIEGAYLACSSGRIWSNKRKNGYLKSLLDKNGYHRINICNYGVHTKCIVHVLIAKAFHGIPQKGLQVDHKNGDKNDNTPKNLEWVTGKENVIRSWKNGQSFIPKGSKNKTSKAIVQLDLNGKIIKEWGCMSDVNRELGYKVSGISACCTGRKKTYQNSLWKHKN